MACLPPPSYRRRPDQSALNQASFAAPNLRTWLMPLWNKAKHSAQGWSLHTFASACRASSARGPFSVFFWIRTGIDGVRVCNVRRQDFWYKERRKHSLDAVGRTSCAQIICVLIEMKSQSTVAQIYLGVSTFLNLVDMLVWNAELRKCRRR
jgi:hypothetical protein